MDLKQAFAQLDYLAYELSLLVNRKWWRWITCWFGSSAGVILSYRLDRFFYLLFGNSWAVIRIFFYPLFLIIQLLSAKHEIHYKADLGKGIMILHASLGIVVNGATIAGKGLLLTGGNLIGKREVVEPGGLILGDHVSLGANAVVLGPIKIGNQVRIGASAVVIHDAPDNAVLVGVPAQVIKINP